MRSFASAAIAAAALMSAHAAAAVEQSVGAPPPPAVTAAPPAPSLSQPAPPAYVRPGYGYQLPKDWMATEHYVADYRAYGLPRPARGFGWSRYYDDAVLTDQWGRVYDARPGYDWDRRGHRHARRDHRDDDRAYGDRDEYRGAHWSDGYRYAAYSGGETVTTTTTTTTGGCCCTMVPHQVVTYENVYAPAAILPQGKQRRTTSPRPRVRGDY